MYNSITYNKEYYAKNKEREKARVKADYLLNHPARRAQVDSWHKTHRDITRRLGRESHERRRTQINSIKNVPCMDCGVKYNPWVMQFDHRNPKDKLFTVGVKISMALKKVLAEIAKCDIVCANCHAERTHKQQSTGARV